jgi:hypothetical protein
LAQARIVDLVGHGSGIYGRIPKRSRRG